MSDLTDYPSGRPQFTKVTAGGSGSPGVVPRNPLVTATEFHNRDASISVYIHHENSFSEAVTNAKGRLVLAGGTWTDAATRGPWYVFAASSTVVVGVAQAIRE